MKNNRDNITLSLFAILTAFFLTLVYFYIPKSVDAGLVLSGIIKYPEHPSLMKAYFVGSFSFLNFLSAFLLNITGSVIFTSKIIIFLNTLLLAYGFSFLIFGISQSKCLSILITIAVLFLDIKSGSGDYPTLYFSEHIYGSISFSFLVFFFGTFISKKFFLSGLALGLFFIIHPVTSLWLFLHIFFLAIIFKIKNIIIYDKLFFKGFFLGIILFIFFLLLFEFIQINNNKYLWDTIDTDFIENYFKYFDSHRGKTDYYLKVNIFILILNFFLILFIYNFKNNKFFIFLLTLIILLNLNGQIMFFISRFFFDEFPNFIKTIMPTRFLTFCSPILIPTFISFLYNFLINQEHFKKKFLLNKNYFISFFLFLLLIIFFSYPKRINSIINTIEGKKNYYNLSKVSSDDSFWVNLRGLSFKGHLITFGYESYVQYISLKPILLDTTALDMLPYFKKLSKFYNEIIKNVYGLEIKNIDSKYRNRAKIPAHIAFSHFKNLNESDWSNIKKKYDAAGIVLDNNIKLKIKPFLKGKFLNLYLFK